jgi:hypothetical protein
MLGMRTLPKIAAELRVLVRARRNRTDLLRFLVRRPAILGAVGAYETALLVSSRADTRLKLLAQVATSSLIGCPF